MNRQQRRREKRKKNPTYNLTAEQLASIGRSYTDQAYDMLKSDMYGILKEEGDECTLEALTLTLYIPMLVMRNHGYGKKRLKKFAEEMIEQIGYYEEKAFTTDDIKKVIKDETGLELEFELDFKNQRSIVRVKE